MRILLVDPYPFMRVGMTVCLHEIRSGLEVEEASTLAEALSLLDQGNYDLVVLSLTLPDSGGVATANAILDRPSPPNLAVCAGFSDAHVERELMDTAARAIIRKEWPLERQRDILQFLLRGIDAVEDPQPSEERQDSELAATIERLSPRRREVLELICRGYRNKEIARALQLEENTVKIHVRHILRTLGASSRIQAALIGRPVLENAARLKREAGTDETGSGRSG